MTKRIIAIAFIFMCTAVAWIVLGATIFERTNSADRGLRGRVSSTWGTIQEQPAPVAFTERIETRVAEGTPVSPPRPARRPTPRGAGAPETTAPTATAATAATAATTVTAGRPEQVRIQTPLALERTRATVAFDLDHRQKGLLWYSTYAVDFDGTFVFRNVTTSDSVTFEFRLPTSQAVYDGLRITIDGLPVPYAARNHALVVATRIARGDTATFGVAYRSQGLDEWRYSLGSDVTEVKDFELVMRTNFDDIDFPPNTLSATEKAKAGDGWTLRWRYANLLSGFQIGMDMPKKLQPGPLAGRIALFAPVSLLFFFAVLFLVVTLRRIDLHPMNYAFLAAGFFSFHLLLAYLVDHISIHLAFAIASLVSIGLVVSYLRLVVGPRFALREAAAAQLIYLVLFSYAFFFEGLTGLAITIGSILTLFVAMQLTGRVRWSEAFAEGQRKPA